MTKRDKVTVDDIIGIVHTDETTNSVEEVRKLRGRTNERFMVDDSGTLIDMVTRDTFDYVGDVVSLLNQLNDENEQLKKDCTVLIYHNQEYRKENEQLKSKNRGLQSELQIFKEDITHSNLQINKLTDENEELKQFKEKVFVLLDEKIKHYEHKPFSAPVGQPMSVNFDADVDRLARLSELQDLEKELQE